MMDYWSDVLSTVSIISILTHGVSVNISCFEVNEIWKTQKSPKHTWMEKRGQKEICDNL